MLVIDGFDEAMLGMCTCGPDSTVVAAYYGPAILDILIEQMEMDTEEAVDWYVDNIESQWAGIGTPVVVWPAERDEGEDDGDLGMEDEDDGDIED